MSGKARSGEAARTIRDFGAAADEGAREHYADPAYYSKTYKDRRHDVDYNVRLARQSKGPVLEYGVGNGRIALHVARAGIEVHGVDLSRPMLDDFQDKDSTKRCPAAQHSSLSSVIGEWAGSPSVSLEDKRTSSPSGPDVVALVFKLLGSSFWAGHNQMVDCAR